MQGRGGELEKQVEPSLNFCFFLPTPIAIRTEMGFLSFAAKDSSICGCSNSQHLTQSITSPGHYTFSWFLLVGEPVS